jgi:hypothetical protein
MLVTLTLLVYTHQGNSFVLLGIMALVVQQAENRTQGTNSGAGCGICGICCLCFPNSMLYGYFINYSIYTEI